MSKLQSSDNAQLEAKSDLAVLVDLVQSADKMHVCAGCLVAFAQTALRSSNVHTPSVSFVSSVPESNRIELAGHQNMLSMLNNSSLFFSQILMAGAQDQHRINSVHRVPGLVPNPHEMFIRT